jgi:small subunit ribosomal protein S21
MRVEVKYNNVEKAMKILKKKMFDEGTIRTLMERRYYEKPSTIRRRKKLEAINRRVKEHQKEQELYESEKRKRR